VAAEHLGQEGLQVPALGGVQAGQQLVLNRIGVLSGHRVLVPGGTGAVGEGVTGANRGLGQAFARELVGRGAAKVYGAARHPEAVTEDGVTPVVAVHASYIDTDMAALVAARG
jgi:hypothetical protein